MGMITKADEKFAYVIDQMGESYTDVEFINAFIDTYPSDWEKVVKRWNKHQMKNKSKKHPMAEQRKYLMNISYRIRSVK
jgi:hypothetical protein